MSQGKSGRENASKELLEDETNLGNTGNDLDYLVQEGKPEKLSVLLPKDPEDFIGNEKVEHEEPDVSISAFNGSVDLDDNHGHDDQQSVSPPLDGPSGTSGGLEHLSAPPEFYDSKEMDMKLLKDTICEYIARNEKNVPENGEKKPVLFSAVFASLPKLLPPKESAKLSCGKVFLAVLYLATELRVSIVTERDTTRDQSDFEMITL